MGRVLTTLENKGEEWSKLPHILRLKIMLTILAQLIWCNNLLAGIITRPKIASQGFPTNQLSNIHFPKTICVRDEINFFAVVPRSFN